VCGAHFCLKHNSGVVLACGDGVKVVRVPKSWEIQPTRREPVLCVSNAQLPSFIRAKHVDFSRTFAKNWTNGRVPFLTLFDGCQYHCMVASTAHINHIFALQRINGFWHHLWGDVPDSKLTIVVTAPSITDLLVSLPDGRPFRNNNCVLAAARQ
jgi:hypothetical protein